MKTAMLIHPEELSKRWIDKLFEAKVGVLGLHPKGGRHATDALKELLSLLERDEYKELIDYACRKGLEIEYHLHAAGYLMPRELFGEHPEYFRVDNEGKRNGDWNFCVSDKNALTLFSKRAAELASRLYKSSHRFYFWMDDGKDLGCHCPSCASLSFSDQQMTAINAITEGIRSVFPDGKAAYLAYYDSLVPPAVIKPADGVFLQYAPMEKYTAKGDDRCERVENERKMLLPLMACFPRESAEVLEYWYDNSLYSGWKKPPKRFILDEAAMLFEAAEYKRLGFLKAATFACFLGEDYTELYGDADVGAFKAVSEL